LVVVLVLIEWMLNLVVSVLVEWMLNLMLLFLMLALIVGPQLMLL
jgi:hypothetical protein